MSRRTPEYDRYQGSFHKAFEPELTRMIQRLKWIPQKPILDVPCGPGFYTGLLASRVREGQHLTAIDNCEAYLQPLRDRLKEILQPDQFHVQSADAYHLPYDAESFDLIWCAESLISLDPKRALSEMYRLITNVGQVVVYEVDEFHHVMLPWPVELEAALPAALLHATQAKYGSGTKHSPARRLRKQLREVGFPIVRRRVYAFERTAPFEDHTTRYLKHHFHYLREFAYPYLDAPLQDRFDRFTDDAKSDSIFKRPDAELTIMTALYTAGKMLQR